MSYSTRTRRTAAATAQAAIKRSTTQDVASSSTPRRRALAKSVSYAEIPAGIDDPMASDRSSDAENVDVEAAGTPLEEDDAEEDEDAAVEDVNGKIDLV
jgi:hypothetical protein